VHEGDDGNTFICERGHESTGLDTVSNSVEWPIHLYEAASQPRGLYRIEDLVPDRAHSSVSDRGERVLQRPFPHEDCNDVNLTA
jgi:hypothetical protein